MASQTQPGGALLTVPEVAAVLRVSRALAYRMVASGDLPSTRVSRRSVRVPTDALAAWIKQRTQEGA